MPPNFICFFGHRLLEKEKNEGLVVETKRGTGAHKNQERGLIKIEKRESCVLSLLSHFSLFFLSSFFFCL